MGKMIQYSPGEILCKKTGVSYLEDDYRENGRRYVKALCKCNRIFSARVDLIKTGKVCPDCAKYNQLHQRNQYKKGDILNDIGTIFLEYTTKNNHGEWYAKMICGKCGEEYEGRISHAKSGCKCSKCRTNKEDYRKINPGDVIEANNGLLFYFIEEKPSKIFESRVTRYGLFVLINENKKWIGEPFVEQINHVKTGKYTGLGYSIGEYNCLQSLKQLGLDYQREYCFPDLKNDKTNKSLRFDFFIKNDNNKFVIELDGEQHYKPIEYFGGEEGYKDLVYRDKLKEEYCRKNNIPLYRISYKDYNKISPQYLKEMLEKELI